MSRTVESWTGATDDAAIPKRVRLRIWDRCGGCCALTGRKIMAGEPWQVDHIVALINGGAHAEHNLQVVSDAAHKIKTRADVDVRVKTDRMRAKHLGLWPKSKTPMKSRNSFPKRTTV